MSNSDPYQFQEKTHIELRADTYTLPSPEMRKAMYQAEVGNDGFGEDPTVNKLENLTAHHCRWPLGEKMVPATLFCGRKPMENFPYCQLHLLYAFQPKNLKEEDQITEEDIPQFIGKKIKSA